MSDKTAKEFYKSAHARYFANTLNCLPAHYAGLDTSRLTVIYFGVVALDILDAISLIRDKDQIIKYVYLNQLPPNLKTQHGQFGFVGSPYLGHNIPICRECGPKKKTSSRSSGKEKEEISRNEEDNLNISTTGTNIGAHVGITSETSQLICGQKETCCCLFSTLAYHQGHLAMTYTALATLLTLGDDLSRVNKASILSGLRHLQQDNGCFSSTQEGGECDMRFLFCACAISFMLGDWSAVDKDKAVAFILNSLTYEGGIALFPNGEAHGGSVYCGVASLKLMSRMEDVSPAKWDEIIGWCESRQVGGYQGRLGKDPDTCYAFWVGSTLHMLDMFKYTDIKSTKSFIMVDCQKSSGGFSKLPDTYADVLHSFYSLCWLSMAGEQDEEIRDQVKLKRIDPQLAVCIDKAPRN